MRQCAHTECRHGRITGQLKVSPHSGQRRNSLCPRRSLAAGGGGGGVFIVAAVESLVSVERQWGTIRCRLQTKRMGANRLTTLETRRGDCF